MSFDELSNSLFTACLNVFGEFVHYMPKDGQAFSIQGIFIKDYQLIKEGQFESVISTTTPAVEVAQSEMKCIPKALDHLSIRGQTYKVAEVQPNNEGQIKLILKKAKE